LSFWIWWEALGSQTMWKGSFHICSHALHGDIWDN
jgi:hypothetical protein